MITHRWQTTQLVKVPDEWDPDNRERWMPCRTHATRDQAVAEAGQMLARSKSSLLRFGVRDLATGDAWEVTR